MKKNLFEYLMAEWGMLIGGFFMGFSLPIGMSLISPLADFMIFFPVGILLVGTSYYYKFYKK